MFESFKKWMQDRIEKNAVKIPNITWEDKKGEMHTEDIILKRSRLPLIGDWERINPAVNEDGSWNKINLIFGGRKNLIKLLLIMAFLTMLYFWVTGILGAGAEYLNGDKYVIISKELFTHYCATPTETLLENLGQGNITIYK